MRTALCLLGALTVMTAIGTPAHAQNYPWCAYYSGRGLGGATNCGFTTRPVSLSVQARRQARLAADAPAAVGSAAPRRARRTKRPKAAAGSLFDDRRGVLNLRVQACRAR